MKVKELIEKLKEFDGEKEVIAKFGLGENDEIGYPIMPVYVADMLGDIIIYCEYSSEGSDEVGQIDLIEARNRMLEEKNEISQLNAYKLIEAPYMADLLEQKRYYDFTQHLKQSEVEMANKIRELVDKVNELSEKLGKVVADDK